MYSIQKNGIIIASLLIGCNAVYAQIDLSKFEVGLNGNVFIYQGDLTPSFMGSFKTIKPGAGIFVNRFLNQSFSLRANFSYGNLKGDDALYSIPGWRKERNLNFSSPVIETSLLAVWNILGKNGSKNNYGFAPYIFAGVGYSFLNIKRDWSKFNTSYFSAESRTANGLAADEAHHLPNRIPIIPVGIGLRYAISKHFSINTEFSYRITSSDYLDGFSQVADPVKKDHYYTGSTGLIYSFGEKNRMACPVLRN